MKSTRIKNRTLDRRTGREGPAHDPYSFTEYSLTVNGRTYTAHMGLACWLRVAEGRRSKTLVQHDSEKVEKTFERFAGFRLRDFDRYYDRIHPYFDDPMGNPSDYI